MVYLKTGYTSQKTSSLILSVLTSIIDSKAMSNSVVVLLLLFTGMVSVVPTNNTDMCYKNISCNKLLPGQYICTKIPKINTETQSAEGCNRISRTVEVTCTVAPGINCTGMLKDRTFKKAQPCRYTNGYDHTIALMLSVFLGMFGMDRFYLGYPALGLLKLSTLGFFFLFQLVDIILIAMQIVGPADGSEYVIDYYGPRLFHITQDSDTYHQPL
ncbi:TM2 domain-containing protein CG10795-like [Xenia sp. Carnegie-2017]|uniref:TM2 domain-containing protein CG10795-like n=1 Tax=Xenia sp. Carnegie-2017 TaxID=2897299 RepID=UPI001F032EAB|nr:TM2 domain-containing protein CG10795-like [Xenia sp. Carnegie-2017]